MNLLANAIDAIEEACSEGDAQGTDRQIILETELTLDHCSVVLRIRDAGIGMSEAVKQKAFEHLFTIKEMGKGTGLGLAIARSIVVEKHGGTLEVNSTLGQGTEFALTIPVTIPVQRSHEQGMTADLQPHTN